VINVIFFQKFLHVGVVKLFPLGLQVFRMLLSRCVCIHVSTAAITTYLPSSMLSKHVWTVSLKN